MSGKTWEDREEMRQEARQDEALEAIADYEEAQMTAAEREEVRSRADHCVRDQASAGCRSQRRR